MALKVKIFIIYVIIKARLYVYIKMKKDIYLEYLKNIHKTEPTKFPNINSSCCVYHSLEYVPYFGRYIGIYDD